MNLFYTSLLIISTITIIYAVDLSSSINAFSNKIYKSITKDENLIFSPFSAHSALSLAYEGAAGETSTSFQNALNLPDTRQTALGYKNILDNLNSAKNINVNVANKIYLQNDYKLRESFQSIAQTYFDAGVDTIDFEKGSAAANTINKWVKEKTNNKIDKLFEADDFSAQTRAVLLNAIYFKGNWLLRFRKDSTRSDKFYVSQTKSILHPMMYQQGYFNYAENSELDAKILKMDYENRRFAMTIVLPNSITGINDLERKLYNIDLNALKTEESEDKVIVKLPKFKIESTFKLEDPLKEIGLGQIFTNAANFSNMIQDVQNLKIEKVIQKAFIEVNEEGAEAAAATGIGIALASLGPPQPTFIADHPFMFFITAKLGEESSTAATVLFVGKVVSPTYET